MTTEGRVGMYKYKAYPSSIILHTHRELSICRAEARHSFDSNPTPMVIVISSESQLLDATFISGCPINKEEEIESPKV